LRRQPYTLTWREFPEAFQRDVETFARRLAGGARQGPWSDEGPRHALSPASVKMRLFSLRQAASALVLLGRDPATIIGLADLVEQQAFKNILTFYWRRAVDYRRACVEIAPDADPGQAGGYRPDRGDRDRPDDRGPPSL
jgi:hypothetical protein